MTLAEQFRDWALNPARTNEELFTVELLIAWGRVVWGWKHKKPPPMDWEADRKHREERRLNPAYRAVLNREHLDCTVEVWDQMKKLGHTWSEDRPVRDLSVLQFFPHFEELDVQPCEVADLSPLAGLRQLKKLGLSEPHLLGGHVVESMEELRNLPALETVSLNLRAPWPDLRALATLPALRMFSYHGNLLALRDVPMLPRAEVVKLDADFHLKTPLKTARDLPEMPEVRRLQVEGVASLDGIERCPRVVNLELTGTFRDLSPLAALRELTYVKLEGEQFTDLSPLARLPRLRQIVLKRQRPVDVTPLSDAPELREVRVENCPIVAMEVATLNAVLTPWSVDFGATPPRTLSKLRFIRYNPQHPDVTAVQRTAREMRQDARSSFYGMDEAFKEAEARWFVRRAQRRLDALLGQGWGEFPNVGVGGGHLIIRRYRDVMRFRELVQALRELSAQNRFGWRYMISVQPHGDMSEDMEEIRKRQNPTEWFERPFDAEREREEWESFCAERRKEREFLEREHRLRLQEQQGLPINPADFSPEAKPPAGQMVTPEGGSESTEEEDEADAESADEGGIATPPPPDGSQSDLAEDLGFIINLHEDILWVTAHMVENTAYIYGEEPEDWHKLPMPLEDRPEPG